MTKPRDARKEAKKSPVKSLKEKRNDKHLKKESRLHQDFLLKPLHGPIH